MENNEKQNTSEARPHVHLFGEEVSSGAGAEKHFEEKCGKDCGCGCAGCHCHGHRHHSGFWGGAVWGLAVLLAGILLLLNNTGLVSKDIWNYIWPFWPVVLIFVGIKIVLGWSRVAYFLIFFLSLITFCSIILYGLIQVNSPLVGSLHVSPQIINYINQLKQ